MLNFCLIHYVSVNVLQLFLQVIAAYLLSFSNKFVLKLTNDIVTLGDNFNL